MQVATYLLGLLQIAGGFILTGLLRHNAELRKAQVDLERRLAETREQMLRRDEFRADMTALLTKWEDTAKDQRAANEAVVEKVGQLAQQVVQTAAHLNAVASTVADLKTQLRDA